MRETKEEQVGKRSAPQAKQDPDGLQRGLDEALGVIRMLASEIGPRRPCSEAEAEAARRLAAWLEGHEVKARVEEFDGYASFGYPYGVTVAAALAGGILQRRHPGWGDLLALGSAVATGLEGDHRLTPLSDLLSQETSTNVVASIGARGEVRRRVCLCAHMDSTRSGLIFHPAAVRQLPRMVRLPALSTLVLAGGPLLRRLPGGGALRAAAIGGLVLALAMLAERELLGEDVPGANDNASACGVVAQLAAECAAEPLQHTQVDVLITGCEEAGMLGAQAYARQDAKRGAETTFLNFDSVGGDAPLTYILGEGVAVTRPSTPWLVELAEQIAERRPELGLVAAETTAGLPTDATPMLARGWDAITFLAQDEAIPNYHWPTDTFENIAPQTVARTLETGREFLSELDRRASAAA